MRPGVRWGLLAAALAALWNEARAAEGEPREVVAAPDAETLAWREWVEPEPDEVVRGDLRLWDDLGVLDQAEIDARIAEIEKRPDAELEK